MPLRFPRGVVGRVLVGILAAAIFGLAAIAAAEVALGPHVVGPDRIAGALVLVTLVAAVASLVVGRLLGAEIDRLGDALRGSADDAAERRRGVEAQLDRLATLLREMGDAVLIVDPDERVTLANPSGERLLGRQGVNGRRLAEVAREHEVLDVVTAARRDGSATAEIERLEPRRSVRLSARRLPGGDVLLTAQDLTTLRRLETVRRDFVANVSHELRTPIASLKAMAETLEGGALDDREAARDFLGRMHAEIDSLAQLVTELLTLARTESGAEELRREPVAPAAILERAASRWRPLAERAGVALELGRADASFVLVDEARIAEVLANLVHNAIKFTPSGGRVTLSARREGDAVRFELRDTGAGIAREDLGRVFERFYKGERSRAGGGTGLGLAIARHVVEAHGGAISAESEGPGRGATFAFTLPVAG